MREEERGYGPRVNEMEHRYLIYLQHTVLLRQNDKRQCRRKEKAETRETGTTIKQLDETQWRARYALEKKKRIAEHIINLN